MNLARTLTKEFSYRSTYFYSKEEAEYILVNIPGKNHEEKSLFLENYINEGGILVYTLMERLLSGNEIPQKEDKEILINLEPMIQKALNKAKTSAGTNKHADIKSLASLLSVIKECNNKIEADLGY